MSVVGTVEYLASIDTSKLSKDASTVEKKVNDVGSTVSSSGKKSFSSFASSASGAFGSIADGIAGLAKVVSATVISGSFGLSYFIKQASELQSVRASFESLTGSAEATDSAMQQLYNFSFKTAFSTADINQAARMYLAAGVSVDQLGSYLQRVGDVAGATGANLLGLVLPLTQAIGKGKLQTQDWYQIVNQGAGGIQKYIIAALGAGHSTKTFMDDLSAGAVTADVLNQALTAASASGGMAFNGAIKQSETFNGRVSNLLESIKNVALEVLDVDSATGKVKAGGTFDKLSKSIKEAQDWVVANKEEIKKWSNIIITNIIPALSAIATMFVVAKVAAIGFSIAAAVAAGTLSLPILAIVAAIVLVIGVLTFLQVKFNIFGQLANFITSAWNAVKNWFITFWDWLKVSWPLILAIITGPIGIAVYAIVKNFDSIKSALISIWEAVKNTFSTVGSFFAGVFNTVKSIFTSIGSTVGNALGNAFKSAINGVLRFAVNMINDFIDGINTAIRIINKIPGVKLGNIGRLPIPQLAEGGIVSSPTLAMIGEGKESEAVIPLSKLNSIVSNKSSDNRPINITLNMDGIMAKSRNDVREIAKDMIGAINEELKAKNVDLIGGGAL